MTTGRRPFDRRQLEDERARRESAAALHGRLAVARVGRRKRRPALRHIVLCPPATLITIRRRCGAQSE